jgi:hypothetical protein
MLLKELEADQSLCLAFQTEEMRATMAMLETSQSRLNMTIGERSKCTFDPLSDNLRNLFG